MSQDQSNELTADEAVRLKDVKDRDELAGAAIFVVDSFIMDNYDAMQRVTGASRTRLIVEAAIGALIANGRIAIPAEHPDFISWPLPEHLRPDVAAAVAQLENINASMRGGQ